MTRNMVWFWGSFSSVLVRARVLWARGHGFEPRKEQYIFLNVLARMVEWSQDASLKRKFRKERRFEPCFAHIFILIITFWLLLIFIPTSNTSKFNFIVAYDDATYAFFSFYEFCAPFSTFVICVPFYHRRI